MIIAFHSLRPRKQKHITPGQWNADTELNVFSKEPGFNFYCQIIETLRIYIQLNFKMGYFGHVKVAPNNNNLIWGQS